MNAVTLDSVITGDLTLDQISRPTSKVVTAVITVVSLLVATLYCFGIFVLCRRAKRSIKLDNALAIERQRYTTIVSILLIFFSLLDIATATWLVAQYIHTRVYPNVGGRDGVRLSLFSALWTLVTSTIGLSLFLHPKYFKHPLSAPHTQAVWILLTWCLWVASVATLHRALPVAHCAGSAYCTQFRAVFAFGMANTIILTLSMLAVIVLVFLQARRRKPAPRVKF